MITAFARTQVLTHLDIMSTLRWACNAVRFDLRKLVTQKILGR